jgi:hypothetical protein
MTQITNNPTTIARGFAVDSDLKTLNQDVNAAAAGKSTASVQFMAMKLAMLLMNANQDRLATRLKEATTNLNGMTAANQMKEDQTSLKGIRTNNSIKDTDKMGSYSTDTANFYEKAKTAGISFSDAEATAWKSGNVTKADIDTLDSRVKTKQDAFSNTSQADNMEMQKLNTLIGQFTNMGMTMLDNYKETANRIFR